MLARVTPEPVDDRTVRNFAWIMLGALCLGGVGALRRHAPLPLAVALPAAGLALVLVAHAAPRSLVGFYRAWMALGEALGRVTTPVLLGLVFAAVLLPTRLVLLLTGSDPMARRFDRKRPTYWAEREGRGFTREGFERLW